MKKSYFYGNALNFQQVFTTIEDDTVKVIAVGTTQTMQLDVKRRLLHQLL